MLRPFRSAPQRMVWLLLLALLAGPLGAAAGDAWVSIDTRAGVLSVVQGSTVMLKLENIAIGRDGAADVHTMGAYQTPRGEFQIAWVNKHSPFRLFFGLNYPTLRHARVAYSRGLIGEGVLETIERASADGGLPPQNSPLGGGIGIHGLGKGDPGIHRLFNWTEGCVALTNEQIDQLAPWVAIGTRVVIE